MKLIVGLGNPGIEYQFTPHNAGFLALDRIAEVCGATIANRRGRALTARTTLAGQDYKRFVAIGALKAARGAREDQWQHLLA